VKQLGNFKKQIGEKIRARRLEVGFKTQRELAEAMGVDPSRVNIWENGRHLPEGELRKELLATLQADESLLDVGNPANKKELLFFDLVSILCTLDEKQISALLKIARSTKASK
jgi:transcriptional regulator with XRE-family HTH domain